MPSEEEQRRQDAERAAAEAAAAAEAERRAEEDRKAEEDRRARAEVTKSLTDEATVRQLSSTGDFARQRRGY